MPKKLKLNLNDLKVQSFVTALDEREKRGFKGGTTGGDDGCPPTCATCPATCAQTCFTCITNYTAGVPCTVLCLPCGN